MRTFAGIDELAAVAGTHLGYSDWHEVTQEQVNLFANATGDHQWIHVDAERAAAGPFGTTIAHGYLTLSLVPLLVAEVYALGSIRMAVNYGANKVRFPSPVPVGSRIRAGVALASVMPASGGYQIAATVTVEIEGSPKPGAVVETLVLVIP